MDSSKTTLRSSMQVESPLDLRGPIKSILETRGTLRGWLARHTPPADELRSRWKLGMLRRYKPQCAPPGGAAVF